MRNKKGFTLIELLAVIVILAIIALIATPIVVDIIKDAKESAFKQDVKTLYKAATLKISNERKPVFPFYVEYIDRKATTVENLDNYYKGTLPYYGQIKVLKDGKGTVAVYDNTLKQCAYKEYDSEVVKSVKLSVKEKCQIETEIKGDGAPIFTGYSCSNPGNVKVTEEKYFTFDQSTGTITGYNVEGGTDLVIPCNIAGTEVKVIGSSAFSSKGLTSVIMPDTVKTIKSDAFNNNKIETLELGNKLETIEYAAFKSNQIKEIVFPDSLKELKSIDGSSWGAFVNNPKLTKVTFGSGIEKIDRYTFYGVSSLIEVDLSRAVNLQTIENYAFYNTKITELDLSHAKGLTTIGYNAFYGNKLNNVKLNGTNLVINESAFSGNQIASLSIDGSNVKIGSSAFQNNLIEELELKGTIIETGKDAFKNNQLEDEDAFIMGRDSSGEMRRY